MCSSLAEIRTRATEISLYQIALHYVRRARYMTVTNVFENDCNGLLYDKK